MSIVPAPRRARLLNWRIELALIALAVSVYLIFTAARVQRQAASDETRSAGAIVVFGAAEYAGRPSPVYRARLDHAYDLFQRGVAPLVITTGGGANDPTYTEGGVGRDYLIARGIPDLNLIAETQSGDTAESARRITAILRTNGVRTCDTVSDAYHMFRIKKLMEAQGVTAYASPRPGSVPHTRAMRAWVSLREAFSYFVWKLGLP